MLSALAHTDHCTAVVSNPLPSDEGTARLGCRAALMVTSPDRPRLVSMTTHLLQLNGANIETCSATRMIDVFGAHYVFDASEESLEFIRQGCHDLEMTWDHGPRWLTARRFVARRRIVGSAPNGIGILHELSDALANCDVNVVTVAARETHQSNENRFVFDLNVEVHDVDRLLSKLTELETIPGWIIRSAEIDA